MSKNELDIKTLESWLWDAACKIRGPIDAPKFKDYILPLIFLKRLSDVFENEVTKLSESYDGKELAEQFIREDHSLVRFYLPEEARWKSIAQQTTNVGEYLTDAVRTIARENPKLQGVIDIVDFNATAAGQSAGEFYTPREVAILMSYVLDPEPSKAIYDPCCGSGGLLIKCYLRFREKYDDDPSIAPLKFNGQEILHTTFAMAKMNAFIHDMETQIALGDTMNRLAFTNPDGSLQKFDIVTANPMWNQDFSQNTYENDSYNRFNFGYPPSSSADWGWIQHMFASLNENGKMAVVLDTGAVSRGSRNVGKNRERDIRKEFVDKDLVEAVILMPENLFYNTTAPGIILVINNNKFKPIERRAQILLINASKLFKKGRPKNYLPDESIKQISEIYLNWEEAEGISKIITTAEAAKNDYNLSPSRYVAQNGEDDTLPLEDAAVQLQEAEEERIEADNRLQAILRELRLEKED